MKTAYFAGGCFWCITPPFEETPGVDSVVSGYCGGDEVNPAYEQVKHQQTGHREAVAVTYDETRVSYGALLRVFLAHIDPFDAEGQFIDRGFSYTTAIFFGTAAEERQAAAALEQLKTESGRTPCVSVLPLKKFWPAEEYHQEYWKKHPEEFAKELRESGRLGTHPQA